LHLELFEQPASFTKFFSILLREDNECQLDTFSPLGRPGTVKIGLLVKRFIRTGGAERCAVELVRQLVGQGHEVHIFAQEWDPRLTDGCRLHRVPMPFKRPSVLNAVFFAWITSRMIRQDRYDIIHSFERTVRYDLTYVTSICYRNWLWRGRTRTGRIIQWTKVLTSPRHVAHLVLERLQMRSSSLQKIAAASDVIRRDIADNYGRAPDMMEIIYSGVDCEEYCPERRIAARQEARRGVTRDESELVFLFIGSDFKRKGLRYAIQGLARLSQRSGTPVKLLVVGGGDPQSYRRLAEKLGIGDRVVFFGLVPNPGLFYAAADAVVLPSRREPCSLAVLEAMASGLPVIFSADSGNAEMTQDGVDALFVNDVSDPEAMAEGMGRLRSVEVRDRIGREARKTAERFSWAEISRRTLELYRKILKEKQPRERVLFLHGISEIGGAETDLLAILGGLDRGEFSPVIACPPGPLMEVLKARGEWVVPITLPDWRKGRALYRIPFSIYRLSRLLRKERITILHVNDFWWAPHGTAAAKRVGIPCVVQVRTQIVQIKKVRRYRLLRAQQLLAVSHNIADLLRQGGASPEQVHVLHSGLDLSMLPEPSSTRLAKERLALPVDDPLIGIVAKVCREKGHEDLFRAMALLEEEFPRLRCLVVGRMEDRYENHIKELVCQLGLSERVVFAGFQGDVYPYLAALDLFVLPSRIEGLSLAVLEAMAMGKPVVGTQIGGIPELVEDGKTGRLAAPSDPVSLAETIAALLRRPDHLRAMGEASRKRVEEKFSLHGHLTQLHQVYRRLACPDSHGLPA